MIIGLRETQYNPYDDTYSGLSSKVLGISFLLDHVDFTPLKTFQIIFISIYPCMLWPKIMNTTYLKFALLKVVPTYTIFIAYSYSYIYTVSRMIVAQKCV